MSAELILAVPDGVGSKTKKLYRALADTGTSSSLGNIKILGPRSKSKKTVSATYKTQVGEFKTRAECKIGGLRLPQFTSKRTFETTFNLFEPSPGTIYDIILGRNTLQELGIDIL